MHFPPSRDTAACIGGPGQGGGGEPAEDTRRQLLQKLAGGKRHGPSLLMNIQKEIIFFAGLLPANVSLSYPHHCETPSTGKVNYFEGTSLLHNEDFWGVDTSEISKYLDIILFFKIRWLRFPLFFGQTC